MCRVLRRTSFLSALLFIFVLLGPFARSKAFNHNPVWREYSYLGGMDGIALGSLTALFSAKVRLAKMKLRVVGIAGAMVLVSILCFSIRADRWGLGRDGLRRRNGRPVFAEPLVRLGRLSYEVYLTHIFVVLSVFHLFLIVNKPVRAVPAMFLVVLMLSGVLGAVVSRSYSEPMNSWLRRRWLKDMTRLDTVDRAEVMSA